MEPTRPKIATVLSVLKLYNLLSTKKKCHVTEHVDGNVKLMQLEPVSDGFPIIRVKSGDKLNVKA